MVEAVILRKFRSSSGIAAVTEWFRISETEDDEMSGKLDRAGEVRLLQHLLENSHQIFYRLLKNLDLLEVLSAPRSSVLVPRFAR